MAANTDFKLTHLDNTNIFTFPAGWKPSNENLSPIVVGEDINLSYDNLINHYSYGIGKTPIVLQGDMLDDVDRWKLSSAIIDRKLKKLWLGEDWYYYVLGMEARKMRSETLPGMGMYTAAFDAVDPFYYFSNDSTPKTSTSATWDASTEDENIKTITLDLREITVANNTTFVEPIFWIQTFANSTVSRIRIEDDTNRKLDVSFTQGVSETWLIMPYLKTSYEGFLTEGPIIIKTQNTPGMTTNFALDLPIYLDYLGGTLYLVESSMVRATTEFISDTAWKTNRRYPRAEDDVQTTFSITPKMTSTGASDTVFIRAQYLLRKI